MKKLGDVATRDELIKLRHTLMNELDITEPQAVQLLNSFEPYGDVIYHTRELFRAIDILPKPYKDIALHHLRKMHSKYD